jgi:hypothetical protein
MRHGCLRDGADGFYPVPRSTGGASRSRCTRHDDNTVTATAATPPASRALFHARMIRRCTPTPDGGACDDRRDYCGRDLPAGACGAASPVVPCTDMSGLWSVVASNVFGSTLPAVAEVCNETASSRSRVSRPPSTVRRPDRR